MTKMVNHSSIFQDIGRRMHQTVLLGVTGPVRTGKSTFVKRFMEQLVLPNMDDAELSERTRDELPQSGSGRMIMTSEPKFVPEEAVDISPDGITHLSVRLIDSVGYVVPNAIGAEEDGQPRMVSTPWFDDPISMEQAAEIGTKKVMDDHATAGIVVTTDGTITDLSRDDYAAAEAQAIEDMRATGKPFIVLVNSAYPNGEEAQRLAERLKETYRVPVLAGDCRTLTDAEFSEILSALLEAFPANEFQFLLPQWIAMLDDGHPLKSEIYSAIRSCVEKIESIGEAAPILGALSDLDWITTAAVESADLGDGTVYCRLSMPQSLFYQTIAEQTGFEIEDEADLLATLKDLSAVKRSYQQIENALAEVQATGYGIVMPSADQMQLETPQMVRKGGNYAIKLKASAPSIHMIRTDIETEVSPIVGDERQSKELSDYLLSEYDDNSKAFWDSKLFGKTLYDLVSEGLSSKLTQMPDNARVKFRSVLSKVVNDGANGMICILY